MRRVGVAGVMGATGLSLGVHAALLAALALGVSWRNPLPVPLQATLWTALPPMPAVEPPPPAPKPAPQPVIKPAPKPTHPADIGLQKQRKDATRKKSEEARQHETARRQAEDEKRAALLAERTAQEKSRREKTERTKRLQAELEQQMREEIAAELASESAVLARQQAQRADQAQQLSRQQRQVLEVQDRIRLKIRGLLRLPPGLKGNPEAVFRVTLLPNGEVSDAELLRHSGQPEYDRAVEHAIHKASPLPLPADPVAARQFREGLTLKFRPQEG